MSKYTIDEIIRLGKSSLQKDRTAYAKAVRQLFSKVDTAIGGWNPAGGEADDVDLHDMVDGVIELPRIEGVGRVAVVRRKREQTLYVGRRKFYWRWFNVLWEERGTRENPGPKRRTPAILRHCVAKVAPKRGVSGAYAICTASLQRAGVMRGGKLTAMGKVRDAARRKRTPENRAKDAAFERALVRGNPSPKGQPTPLNLDVLVRTFGVLDRVSNKLDPTDVPHLSRCMKAGLLAPEGRTHLALTPAGVEARNRHLASRPYLLNSANETRPNPGKATCEKHIHAMTNALRVANDIARGARVKIKRDSQQTALYLSYKRDLPDETIDRLDRAVVALGWRSVYHDPRLIVFKPSTVFW